jgi:serine/threonine protein phosphatase PrpC
MPEVTTTRPPLAAYAGSHPGLHRENNEDRCYADADRGIFFVVDGVGGQAAGDKAAEIAQDLLRARLERETGTVAERLREAITLANNEIHRASQTDARWNGMACVLTVAVVRDGRATVGHVGDTRLYILHGGTLRKVTRDHSPVGDREDRGELSEIEAMRHPRRNEIFRDVGSEPHNPEDEEFIDVFDVPFDADSALLLCTDGLSDMVTSAQIAGIVAGHAGDPPRVVTALLEAANAAGGKDNVSAVFVEGERFAASTRARGRKDAAYDLARLSAFAARARSIADSRWLPLAFGVLLGIALLLAALFFTRAVPAYVRDLLPAGSWPRTWVVSQDGPADFTSIRAALDRACAGDTVRVEPGEYRERVLLTGSVALVSAKPREAVIIAPPAADGGPGIGVEFHAGHARLSGFRITGDAQNPLAIGVRLRRSDGEVDDVEISRARVAGVQVEGASRPTVRASYIHDNPGIGVVVFQGADPKVLNNVIADNGRQPEAPKPGLELHETAKPTLFGNIIANNGIDAIRGLSAAQREEVTRDNIIGRPAPPPAPTAKPAPGRRPR